MKENITKVSDVKRIVQVGVKNPKEAFPKIKKLAESHDWKEREVAATALVEISKKRADEVVDEMLQWVKETDANVRRAAVEGLRNIARRQPEKLMPVLERAKTDESLYVKKSVANVLRNASKKHPRFVLNLCQKWLKPHNPNTNWIIKDGLRKLKTSHTDEAKRILKEMVEETT